MRAFIGLLFVVCCGSIVLASQNEQKAQYENVKQEKRSLSHIGGYPSSYGSSAGSYGSYGLAGAYANGLAGEEGSIVSSGPVSIGGSIAGGSGGFIAGGPGFIGGGVATATAVGVSTNTDTLTTVRQNVPVPVPV